MKRISISILSAFAVTVAFTSSAGALAAGGIGTRGGGETLVHLGGERLRDLVEPLVEFDPSAYAHAYIPAPPDWKAVGAALSGCRWMSGIDVAVGLPGLGAIFAKLDGYSPDLGAAYRREIIALKFCFRRGGVPRVDEDRGYERYDFAGFRFPKPLALRIDDRVIFDDSLFVAIPEGDRAYAIFHEITHSFIPLEMSARPAALRRFVRIVHDSPEFTRDAYPMILEETGVSIFEEFAE